MGYDTVRLAESIPDKNPDKLGIPDGLFMRPTVTVIFDTVKDMMTIVAAAYPAWRATRVEPVEGLRHE